MRNRSRTRGVNKYHAKIAKIRPMRIILLSVLGLVLACVAIVFIYTEMKFSTLNQKIDVGNFTMPPETEAPASTSLPEVATNDLSKIQDIQMQTLNPEKIYSDPKIINILLLGLDTRNPKQFSGGRTDTIIIVTLDTVNKKVKLTSIMRDTLVSIPDHGMNRINTVFGYYGPDIAMQTVQKYFGVKIDYYAVVNFWAVSDIIDSVGGVEVNIKSSETADLNKNLDEINRYSTDENSPHVKNSGTQVLDGKQAVGYMRIRHVGEGDFERTERQRNVIEAIINKDFSLSEILSIANSLPDNVRMNVGLAEMASLANTAFSLKGVPVQQLRLPVEGSYRISRYKEMSVLIVDFAKNVEEIKKFLSN